MCVSFPEGLKLTLSCCIPSWHGGCSDDLFYDFVLVFFIYIYIYIYIYQIIEGSLDVKLPTIWTDEKQSREEEERRERLEERRVEEKE